MSARDPFDFERALQNEEKACCEALNCYDEADIDEAFEKLIEARKRIDEAVEIVKSEIRIRDARTSMYFDNEYNATENYLSMFKAERI